MLASQAAKAGMKPFKENNEYQFALRLGATFMSLFLPMFAIMNIVKEDTNLTNMQCSSMTACLKEPWIIQGCKVDWVSVSSIGDH